MKQRLLPIGTIVKLYEKDRLMMICGYCPMNPERVGYVYDYSGFVYPEGYRDAKKIYVFDNTDIEETIAMGYQDKETLAYVSVLEKKIDMIKQVAANKAMEKEEKADV